MELNPVYEKIQNATNINSDSVQTVVDCTIQAKEEVEKIISKNADVQIKSININKNAITFNGVANFKLIYINSDNMPQNANYIVEFTDKLTTNIEYMPQNTLCYADVVDINCEVLNTDSIKLQAYINVAFKNVETEESNILTNVEGDSVYCKNEDLYVMSLANTLNEMLDFNYDFEIKDGVLNVLEVGCYPTIKSVKACNGFIKTCVEAEFRIKYLTDGDNKEIKEMVKNVSFNNEFNAPNSTEESVVQSYICNAVENFVCNNNIDVDKTTVKVNGKLNYKAFVFNKNIKSVISDLFSTTNNILVTTSSISSVNAKDSVVFENRISETLKIDDSKPFCDDVMFVSESFKEVTNAYVKNNEIICDGIVCFNVVYLNKENMQLISEPLKCAFSVSSGCDDVSDVFPFVQIALNDISFKCRRGTEIEVNANLIVNANLYSIDTSAVISKIEVKEEKSESNSAITVYFAKPNETVWDIAKKVNVNPDVVLEQNEEVMLPLQGCEKLFIYKQKNMQF